MLYFSSIVLAQRGGYGEFNSSDGTQYVGGWSGDHITGKGRMTYSNGDCYDGNWFKNTVNTVNICTCSHQFFSLLCAVICAYLLNVRCVERSLQQFSVNRIRCCFC